MFSTGSALRALAVYASLALFAGLMVPANAYARAQVNFNGVLTTVGLWNNVNEVAVDGSGNVYVANGQYVYQISPSCSAGGNASACAQIVGGTFYGLAGVGVDGSGNVYAIDDSGRVAWEIPASCIAGANDASCRFHVGGGLRNPTSLTADGSGNIYITDGGYQTVVEISASCIKGANDASCTTFVGGGFSAPMGVAVDSSGNVYVADFGNEAVKEIPASCIAGANNASCTITLGGGFGGPFGVAVDGSGNVFVGDKYSSLLKEIPASCINGANNASCVIDVGPALIQPASVAMAGNGNLYVSNTGGPPPGPVYELRLQNENFGPQAVGSTSAASPLTFTVSADPIGSVVVLTTGAAGLDFANAAGTTCTAQTYTLTTTCVVNVTFTPAYAGLRTGAVVFYSGANNTGAVLASVPIYGVGTGPQLTFGPAQVVQFSGYDRIGGIAEDAAGNQYVATANDPGYPNAVYKVAPDGTTTSLTRSIENPNGIAVDGAGNIYVSDISAQQVQVVSPAGVVSLASGFKFNSIGAVAVDGAGNLYVLDEGAPAVYEITAANLNAANSSTPPTVGSGFGLPYGLALDGAGNVYVSDRVNLAVYEIAPNGTQTKVGSGYIEPDGIAVDAAGDVYVADPQAGIINEVTPKGVQTALTPPAGSAPVLLAISGAGNLFVASQGHYEEIVQATAPSLTFASTAAGSASSDSPQTVTLQNIGNAPLTFPIPSSGNNPSIEADFTLLSSGPSACPLVGTGGPAGTLAASASCLLPISFHPLSSGAITGSLVLTDNNLNASGATQSVSLQGFGIPVPAIGVTSSASSVMLSNPVTLTATVSSGTGTPTGTVSFFDGATLLGTSTLAAGSATLSTSALTKGTHAITVTYSGDANFGADTSAAFTQTVVDFTFSAASSGNAGGMVAPGGIATYSLLVAPSSGTSFPAAVTLAITGLPAGASTTLTPSAWLASPTTAGQWTLPANTPINGAMQLSIQLPQTNAANHLVPGLGSRLAPFSLALFLLPFAGRLRRAGKKLGRVLSILLLFAAGLVATAGVSGCGSSSAPPKAYILTGALTSGTLSHSATVTLTVQ